MVSLADVYNILRSAAKVKPKMDQDHHYLSVDLLRIAYTHWLRGKDTQWIADCLCVEEYQVYNSLSRYRELQRNRGQHERREQGYFGGKFGR